MGAKLKHWQMVKEAIKDLGGSSKTIDIITYIQKKYGTDVKEGTLQRTIIQCTVNNPGRVHYSGNLKPRGLDPSRYDFLYLSNKVTGIVELYDPQKHGNWEIIRDDQGRLIVAQTDFDESLDEIEKNPLLKTSASEIMFLLNLKQALGNLNNRIHDALARIAIEKLKTKFPHLTFDEYVNSGQKGFDLQARDKQDELKFIAEIKTNALEGVIRQQQKSTILHDLKKLNDADEGLIKYFIVLTRDIKNTIIRKLGVKSKFPSITVYSALDESNTEDSEIIEDEIEDEGPEEEAEIEDEELEEVDIIACFKGKIITRNDILRAAHNPPDSFNPRIKIYYVIINNKEFPIKGLIDIATNYEYEFHTNEGKNLLERLGFIVKQK